MDYQDFDMDPEETPQFPPESFRDDEFRDTFGEGEDLQSFFADDPIFHEEDEAEPEPVKPKPEKKPQKKETPVKKRRPQKKGTYGLLGISHILATAVWLAIIIAVGASIGSALWLCATDILAFGREPITATVVIEQGDTIDVVASKLKNAKLIRYTGLFEFYADLTDAQEEIRPGTYNFNETTDDAEKVVYDYMALVSKLTPSSKSDVVEDLRIPEGYTCRQIFKLLEEQNVCTVEELEDYVMEAELDNYWFLKGLEKKDANWLEGYLFPNTYDFYVHDEPERVIKKMLNAFEDSFTKEMQAELNSLNSRLADMMGKNGYGSDYIEDHKMTIHDVMIVASMLEKETANNAESFTISSVIYNRLADASDFPYLNIDATLVYILDGKADLTNEDKEIDDPYNTYKYKGLPPGPISNPSLNSIKAALKPEDTKYYYYAYNPETMEHHFTSTYKDHLAFLDTVKKAAEENQEDDE